LIEIMADLTSQLPLRFGLHHKAWIESGSTGAILIFTSSYIEKVSTAQGISRGTAGLLGGIAGGAAQAYLAMGRLHLPSFF
jgi:hypothetical protein